MALQVGGKAPYAPAPTVLHVLGRYRDANLPSPITSDVLSRIGVSEGLTSRTLQALRLLDLVQEDGTISEIMEGLGRATDEEYQSRLRELLLAVYKPVLDIIGDPAQASPNDLSNAFRSFEPRGQRERMVRLFVGLCQHVGLIPEGKRPKASSTRTGPARVVPPRRKTKDRSKPGAEGGSVPAPGDPEVSTAVHDGDLRTRYVEMLLEKVRSQDDPDDKLLDRIEQMLEKVEGHAQN